MAETQDDPKSMTKLKVVICPYCGETQPAGERCRVCQGLFEPLSRQATHNAMGPWFIRNPGSPYQPGCSYETLVKMVDRGQINRYTIVRGPTTKQFWTVARHTAGVAHLLGYCHNCDAAVNKKDLGCPKCGAPFGAYLERNYMGLPEIKPLPWEADTPDATDQWGAHFGTPRPQATGLSSFGTDEELAGEVGRLAQPAAVHLPGLNGGARARTTMPPPAPVVSTVLDTDQSHLAARQRSLERRITQQQRTIRWLMAAAVGAVVIALLFALDVFGLGGESNQRGPAQDATAPGNAEPARDDAQEPGADELRDESASQPEAPADTESAGEFQPPDGSDEGIAGQQIEEPLVMNPEDPFLLEFARAEQLVAQSRDEEADIDQRIKLVTEAIEILKHIRDTAPPASQPIDLPALLELQERELKRLELKKWLA